MLLDFRLHDIVQQQAAFKKQKQGCCCCFFSCTSISRFLLDFVFSLSLSFTCYNRVWNKGRFHNLRNFSILLTYTKSRPVEALQNLQKTCQHLLRTKSGLFQKYFPHFMWNDWTSSRPGFLNFSCMFYIIPFFILCLFRHMSSHIYSRMQPFMWLWTMTPLASCLFTAV